MAAFKSSFNIMDHYSKLEHALLSSMQRHAWYLTEQLVMLALTDDDVDEEMKKNMLGKLVECDVPDWFIWENRSNRLLAGQRRLLSW